MFDPSRPCPGETKGTTIWKENFERGLPAGWDADVESVFGHPGTALGGQQRSADRKRCRTRVAWPTVRLPTKESATAPEDFSGRDGLITRDHRGPRPSCGARGSPGTHYVATEHGFDGGNVKVSVNGGDFEVIPAGAYITTGPGSSRRPAAGNTNPLAGQAGVHRHRRRRGHRLVGPVAGGPVDAGCRRR